MSLEAIDQWGGFFFWYSNCYVGRSISEDKPQSLLLTRMCRLASGKGYGML